MKNVDAISQLTAALCVSTILLLIGLIPLGQWRDEYDTIALIRAGGLPYMLTRILHWSPRPLSEIFVFAYSESVATFKTPLITLCVAPFWAILVSSAIAPAVVAGRNLVIGLVLLCMFLLGHGVGEVFYWPIGAVAYMPTLAAVALILMVDFTSSSEKRYGRTWVTLALVVAAISTEVGALFTAIYCGMMGLTTFKNNRRHLICCIGPLLVSVVVLLMMALGRVTTANELFGDSAIAHHAVPSFAAAARLFGWELLSADGSRHKMLFVGIVSKLCFFWGTYFECSRSPQERVDFSSRVRSFCLAVALIGSAFLVMVASFYQFGMLCCERHATMRQCYIFAGIGALACLAAKVHPPTSNRRTTSLFLLAAVAVPFWTTAAKITSDYKQYSTFERARTHTWESGQASGDAMTFYQTGKGRIVGGVTVAPGRYKADDSAAPPFVKWVLLFFKKQSVVFSEQGQ